MSIVNPAASPLGYPFLRIGEPSVDTDFENNILSRGFQQPKNINVISIPEVDADLEENYFIYPYPILNDLTLNFTKMKTGNYSFEVYDVSGRLLLQTMIRLGVHPFITKINFKECPNGAYLIKIVNTSTSTEKTFRIIK